MLPERNSRRSRKPKRRKQVRPRLPAAIGPADEEAMAVEQYAPHGDEDGDADGELKQPPNRRRVGAGGPRFVVRLRGGGPARGTTRGNPGCSIRFTY